MDKIEKLFKKYRTLEDYADASPLEFEKDIFSTGFYRNKTKNILAAAKMEFQSELKIGKEHKILPNQDLIVWLREIRFTFFMKTLLQEKNLGSMEKLNQRILKNLI